MGRGDIESKKADTAGRSARAASMKPKMSAGYKKAGFKSALEIGVSCGRKDGGQKRIERGRENDPSDPRAAAIRLTGDVKAGGGGTSPHEIAGNIVLKFREKTGLTSREEGAMQS